MTLPRWNTYSEGALFEEELDPLFEASLIRALDGWPEPDEVESNIPVDLFELSDRLVVFANLPGQSIHEFCIDVSEYTLTIEGQKPAERLETEAETVYFRERESGKFHRKVVLPCEVDGKSLKTSYENGVLQVTLPKL